MNFKKVEDAELLALVEQGLTGKDIAARCGISPAAVCKRLKRIRRANQPMPESFQNLTGKQQEFVSHVLAGDNQTTAALKAYECKDRKSASVIAAKLMKEEEIAVSLADLMASEGITRRRRVQRLAQFIEGKDTAAAVRSLELSFKLDGSMTERIEVGIDSNLIRQLIQTVVPDQQPVIDIAPAE